MARDYQDLQHTHRNLRTEFEKYKAEVSGILEGVAGVESQKGRETTVKEVVERFTNLKDEVKGLRTSNANLI